MRSAAISRIRLASYIAGSGRPAAERPDRSRHDRRHDRRRQGGLGNRRRRHDRQADRNGPRATITSRRWWCASTAPADRCSRPSASARRCSKRKAQKIPVVVSMGSVAASGGYWVSTPADFIYAEPSTITGSIGVFGIMPSFEGTLQKLGIGADGVKTTPLSGEPDSIKGPSPEADQLIQTGVDSIYGRFLGIVAAVAPQDSAADRPDRAGPRVGRRHGSPARPGRRVRRHGRGGRQGGRARQARRRARRDLPRAAPDLQGATARDARDQARATTAPAPAATPSPCWRGSRAAARSGIADVRTVLAGPSIQVRCLECPPVAPARLDKRDLGLLELLTAWLS